MASISLSLETSTLYEKIKAPKLEYNKVSCASSNEDNYTKLGHSEVDLFIYLFFAEDCSD